MSRSTTSACAHPLRSLGAKDHEQKHTEESDDEDEPVAVKDVEPVVAQPLSEI